MTILRKKPKKHMTSADHRDAQIKILERGLIVLGVWFVIFIAGVSYILVKN